VVGLYRTGKSYLMNRLADSSTGKTWILIIFKLVYIMT
jgi:hypothetical protein